jgi:hypothetical protein
MRDQFKKVSLGFRLVYIGILVVILGIIGGLSGMCFGLGLVGAGGGAGGVGVLVLVVIAMMLCVLAGSITGLVGRIFCLATPEEAGVAKVMIIVSVILEVVAIVASLGGGFVRLAGALGPAADVMISGCQGLFSFASPIFFLLFTRSLADYVNRRDLAQSAMTVLWLWVAAVGTYVFGLIMMVIGLVAMAGAGRAGRAGIAGVGCFGLVVLLIALIIAIVALIRYIVLLREMSEATADYSRRAPRKKKRRRDDDDRFEDDDDRDDNDDRRDDVEDDYRDRPWRRPY